MDGTFFLKPLASALTKPLSNFLNRKRVEKGIDKTVNEVFSGIPHDMLALCHDCGQFSSGLHSLSEGKPVSPKDLQEIVHDCAKKPNAIRITDKQLYEFLFFFAKGLTEVWTRFGLTLDRMPASFHYFRLESYISLELACTPVPDPSLPKPIIYLPLLRNTNLRGHEKWIEQIRELLKEEDNVQIGQAASLTGEGGIGKTAMAAEYARLFAGTYPGGVFWLEADQGLAGAARRLGQGLTKQGIEHPLREDLDDPNILRAFHVFLNQRTGSLIILDNVETKDALRDLQVTQSHILVTTRRQDLALAKVAMEMPSDEEALEILLSYADKKKNDLSEPELAAAKEICAKMGNLPLALEILGRVASFDGLVNLAGGLGDYLNRMEETHAKAETSIKAALALAAQKYEDPDLVKEALPYLAYLHPEGIDKEILGLAMGEVEEVEGGGELTPMEDDAAKALNELARFSVIKPREEGGYSVHRLTQEAARAGDEGNEIGERVAELFTGTVDYFSQNHEYRKGYFLIPHLIHLAGFADDGTLEINFPDALLVSTWSDFLWIAGSYGPAEKVARSLLNRVGIEKGEEYEGYAVLLNNLATRTLSLGRFEEAEKLYRRTLKIAEKIGGKDSSGYSIGLGNLAWVHFEQGNFEKAEHLYRQVLDLDEKTIGSRNPQYANHLSNLACVVKGQGRYKEAEELLCQAMDINEKTSDRAHLGNANILNNLAGAVEAQGRYEEAEKLFLRSLEIDEKTIGKEHPDYATHLSNMALAVQKQGHYNEAERLFRRVLEIDKKTVGKEHPKYTMDLNNLAGVLGFQGKHIEGEFFIRAYPNKV